MKREILINKTSKETRLAILEDEQLVELYYERKHEERHLGDIYKGIVSAVLPGMQAAFVDIGTEKSGFLHVSDMVSELSEDYDINRDNRRSRGRSSRPQPSIESQLKRGQEILVQITKEPLGTKGPRLTTQISLPGRFLVYMPFVSHIGVSRKIEDLAERKRLKRLVSKIKPKEGGIIVRTVGGEVSQRMFEREVHSLTTAWMKIQKRSTSLGAPALLHREARLTSGLIRDVFSSDFDSLIIDSKSEYREIKNYLKEVSPELKGRIRLYDDIIPLFDAFGIEDEVVRTFSNKIWLESGGYIIIEETEALISIDVNTGKYTGEKDPEETILKTNLDAAREISRQLRLRNIGGIIVCDFIDMESEENRRRVLQKLRNHLRRDRVRTKAFEVSSLGLIEMTRQRTRPSLSHYLSQPCPTCSGHARIMSRETMARRVERAIQRIGAAGQERAVLISMHPSMALFLLEEEKSCLSELEKRFKLDITIRDDPLVKVDDFKIFSLPSRKELSQKFIA
jgi:ribonuclease G